MKGIDIFAYLSVAGIVVALVFTAVWTYTVGFPEGPAEDESYDRDYY